MNIMKHCLVVFVLALLWLPVSKAVAQTASQSPCGVNPVTHTPDQVRVVGINPQSETVKELLATYDDLVGASNRHAIEEVLKHYNPQYISGDNLKLEQIKDLIVETWQAYPDICYVSTPIEIRVNGDWATIETLDRSMATAPPDKNIMDTPGRLKSESRNLLFFRRVGNLWEITSDSTVWEQAIIRYGIGDDVEIVLSAPEQVKAGELYSATIQAKIPEGSFTIATIDNQALVYPHEKVDDKFRALDPESNELQRVLKANSSNRNEIVTATLGLTSMVQNNPDRPSLALNGVATIVKRVNVVPISAEDVMDAIQRRDVVKTSADGRINASAGTSISHEDTVTGDPELELAPSTDESEEAPQKEGE